jgi:hypothetical protein
VRTLRFIRSNVSFYASGIKFGNSCAARKRKFNCSSTNLLFAMLDFACQLGGGSMLTALSLSGLAISELDANNAEVAISF